MSSQQNAKSNMITIQQAWKKVDRIIKCNLSKY